MPKYNKMASSLSEYENAMFLEVMDDDGLFITAKLVFCNCAKVSSSCSLIKCESNGAFVHRGLSVERVIASFLKIHSVTCQPSSISLVLVINTTPHEEVDIIK